MAPDLLSTHDVIVDVKDETISRLPCEDKTLIMNPVWVLNVNLLQEHHLH